MKIRAAILRVSLNKYVSDLIAKDCANLREYLDNHKIDAQNTYDNAS